MFVLRRILQSASLMVLIVCLSPGCSALKSLSNSQLPTGSDSGMPAQKYSVQIHPTFGAARSFEGTLNEPMTVQTALKAARALKSMRGMEIELHRRVPENGQLLKLQVDYDAREKSVKMEHDYAIHPNDVIILKPKSGSAFGKTVSKILGGM